MTDLFGNAKIQNRNVCLETCGQDRPCGNRHCSAHPKYIPPKQKKTKRTSIGGYSHLRKWG